MLKNMRENLKSYHWVLWLVIGSFVISIFFWDTGVDWTGAVGGTWAASVNGEPIDAETYQSQFRDRVEFLSRAFGERWDPMYVEQVGMADQVIQELVQQKVALQEARRLGLTASSREILDEVRNYPAFLDGDGKFIGVRQYQEILKRNNLDVDEFEQGLDDQITLRKFQDLLRASVMVSQSEVDLALRRERDQVSIEYALFEADDLEAAGEPSDEELRAWYEENESQFQGDQMREVSYIVISQNAALDAVSDATGIQEYYDANPDRFTIPEGTRRARQIVVRVPPSASEQERAAAEQEAEQLAERAKAGESFEMLAREYSDDLTSARMGGDMGYFASGELMPALDAALFEMEEGEIRGPINTLLGYVVVQLTEADRGERKRSLEDARREIGAILYFSQMQDWIAEKANAVAGDISPSAQLSALAEKHGLEVRTTKVARGDGIRELGSFAEITTAVDEGEVGKISGPVTAMDGEQVFLNVTGITDPEPEPLEAIRGRVIAAWKKERAREAAQIAAGTVIDEVRAGADFADALEPHGVELVDSGLFTRNAPVGTLGAQPVLASRAFSLEQGELGGPVETDSGYIAFRLKERKDMTADELDAQRDTYRGYLENIRFQQVWSEAMVRLAEESRVRVNQRLVEAVKNEYLSRSAPQTEPASTTG